MSHQIYHTEGFIIDRRDLRETDVLLYIYTFDFGLVVARVSGIRQVASKMRQHALPLRYIRVSLVRGKELWRVVGLMQLDLIEWASLNQAQKELLSKIANLFRYFVHGEETSVLLFGELKASLNFLVDLDQPNLYIDFECVFALRFLRRLGYVADDKKLSLFWADSKWSQKLLNEFTPFRKEAISLINQSFTASGM